MLGLWMGFYWAFQRYGFQSEQDEQRLDQRRAESKSATILLGLKKRLLVKKL